MLIIAAMAITLLNVNAAAPPRPQIGSRQANRPSRMRRTGTKYGVRVPRVLWGGALVTAENVWRASNAADF